MKTIYEYPFDIRDEFTLEMPAGAEVLTAQTQGDHAYLWASVNPATSAPVTQHTFRLFGTGQYFSEVGVKYISTFQQPPFVWHLFEVT